MAISVASADTTKWDAALSAWEISFIGNGLPGLATGSRTAPGQFTNNRADRYPSVESNSQLFVLFDYFISFA
jgi:6-phosphogluconate dehydrogenase